jgi:hypothetical protein
MLPLDNTQKNPHEADYFQGLDDFLRIPERLPAGGSTGGELLPDEI